ncbi:MAG: hypothetical protein GX615_09360 [Lentisphaerae bacterium]|nr:hypothetical protein [Lentisphaerota bacterium]
MPYTPLHMGPGMFLKATMPRHFSIITFGITQVLIDLEVLWNMTHHGNRLHTFLHTYSCYHVDVEPFLPWSASNPCKGAVEPFKMEIVFNALFIFGLVWLTVGVILKKRAQRGRVANASTLR